MKITAINASPRTGRNTASLVAEAARGAESAGASTERFDLYRLEKYTGCISCFGCKLKPNEGRCVCRDGLSPVLESIRSSDGLIIGTPNYLGDVSAGFRALYERLIFQYITYKKKPQSYNTRSIPVLMIMTCNAPEAMYAEGSAYGRMLENYKNVLGMIGPTRILLSSETLQVNDYGLYDWTMFDPEARKERHEKVFPEDMKKAFAMGAEMTAGR